MGVKKLISFYENQHFFTLLFVHNFLSRWLNESFRHFCISYVEIQKIRFILVHFTKSLFLFFFLWLIGLPVFWRWHHLLLSFWWNWDRFAWSFSIFRLVATFVMMTDTPDTIASKRTKGNNLSLVVPLCSLYSFWLHHMIVKMALHANHPVLPCW